MCGVWRTPQSVSWLPGDAVANLVLDLAVSEDVGSPVLNVVHPRRTPWRETLRHIQEALGVDMPFVPLDRWVERIEKESANATAETLEWIVSSRFLSVLILPRMRCDAD